MKHRRTTKKVLCWICKKAVCTHLRDGRPTHSQPTETTVAQEYFLLSRPIENGSLVGALKDFLPTCGAVSKKIPTRATQRGKRPPMRSSAESIQNHQSAKDVQSPSEES